MPIEIANVELTNTFDNWRVTTNQIIKALREEVVTKQEIFLETVLDSVEVVATPTAINAPTDTVNVLETAKTKNFKAGQKVRIYGARINTTTPYIPLIAPNPPTVAKTGFEVPDNGTDQLTYYTRQFDFLTGKISNASAAVPITGLNLTKFNDVNNVSLTLRRENINCGLLIYRKCDGSTTTNTYNLIAVLGPNELGGDTQGIVWIDNFDFDTVVWSKKNLRNEFTTNSGLIHFPVAETNPPTAPNNAILGWVDTEVKFVDTTTNRLTFTDICIFENSCVVSHDDTILLQDAIDQRNLEGYKSIQLPTKTYITKGIVVPDNFSIIGSGNKSTLKKLSWSSGFSDTGNRLIKSDGDINDFSLSDINIDGNMQNQYLLSETSDPTANYIIDVTGSTFRYENIKINNVIGGGINASDSSSISVISSFIVDSNLSDRQSFSPLNISSSFDVVLSSNIFRNFSGPIEASTLTSGTIVGNIIKNCGSGLLIYGSTNLVSSPNILMGPSSEFLPSPDILNSEYDSVNIKLEPNIIFNSTVYNYQENGESVDLSGVTISHRVDKLQKINNAETLYGDEILVSGNKPIQPSTGVNVNPANGQFNFTISAQNVNVLLNNYSETDLKGPVAQGKNPYHVGLVYRSIATEFGTAGTVSGAPSFTNHSSTISANTVGVNNVNDVLIINNIKNVTTGERWFNSGDRAYYNRPATNTAISGLTANTIYYVSFANNTSVALTAEYNGANVNLNETRIANPSETHYLNKVLYSVPILNASNLATGSVVKFSGHGGNPNFNQILGYVEDYNAVTSVCRIAYDPDINIVTPGSGGTILVENSYVLAKGRIL